MSPSDFARLDERNIEMLHKVDDLAATLHERAAALAKDLHIQSDALAAELRARADALASDLKQRADALAEKLRVTECHSRLDTLATEMKAIDIRDQVHAMSIELKTNSDATQRVEANTQSIVEAFQAVQGGMKVLDFLGKLGIKLLWITVPAALLWGGFSAFKVWITTGFHFPPK